MKKSKLTEKIQDLCKKTYSALKLSGYVRFDLRVTDSGECFFLEANPNPSIAKFDDFSKSIKASGFSYEKTIREIIRNSLYQASL